MTNEENSPFPFFQMKVAVEDTAKPISSLTRQPVVLLNLDIQVQTNPVDFGDRNGQNLQLSVGDFYSNPLQLPLNMSDIWVINHSAGNVGYIVITGIIAK